MTQTNEFESTERRIVTQYDIEALVDNELTEEDAQSVMKIVEEDRALYTYYEQLQVQKKLLMNWWAQSKNS